MNPTKITSHLSALTGDVKEYVWLKLELFRLQATERIARLTTHIMISLILFVLSMFLVFFLSLSFVFWYGEYVGPMYEAALMVSGFFILLAVVIYLLRYPLFINPLVSRLSKLTMEESSDEEE